jgi:hypothetical protein
MEGSGAVPVTTRYVLLYESADDVQQKAPPHFEAHWARALDFHRRGLLLQIGTFADAQSEGSMAVFATREAPRSSSPTTRSYARAWSVAGRSAHGTRR